MLAQFNGGIVLFVVWHENRRCTMQPTVIAYGIVVSVVSLCSSHDSELFLKLRMLLDLQLRFNA